MSGGTLGWILLGLVVVLLFGGWLSWTATRLDQLHHHVDLAEESLRTQLARRTGCVLELAASGLLDPASAVLVADAAQQALRAASGERRTAESDLSATLRVVFDEAEVAQLRSQEEGVRLADDLAGACHRVELARRFHNDRAMSALELRKTKRVRWFGLAGHAEAPQMADLDTTVPTALRVGSSL